MTAATRYLWDRLGQPDFATPTTRKLLAPIHDTCAICGHEATETADADKALGANFTDRTHITLPSKNRICVACLWCCSGRPPATLRMWSIATTPHPSHPKAWLKDTPGVCLTNRANPAPIRDTLINPPTGKWLVTVAYSGQKHVIPYSPINAGARKWTIRVEDHYVTSTPTQFETVHTAANKIRSLGVPEEAVMIGEPRFIKTPDALTQWRTHSKTLHPYLGSPLLRLALWTITKTTMQEEKC